LNLPSITPSAFTYDAFVSHLKSTRHCGAAVVVVLKVVVTVVVLVFVRVVVVEFLVVTADTIQ
jgi:hypothetical protein